MWGGSDKLGPYDNAEARHQFMHSKFHRDRDFCGTCHDVSNPAVGHLAHNHGAQATADLVTADGTLDGALAGKAAFNNPPYKYGIVERTFSEYKAGRISQTLVQDYNTLPADLQGGALAAAYNAATKNGTIDPNYSNPSMPRYFSCQTCHMRPVTGKGANKNGVPVRNDLPLHDMTGGNYWMPLAIAYLNSKGKLRLGGGMSTNQLNAMLDGALRAKEQLELAATLSVSGDTSPTVKIINHTGHKLISGYPEGRRMWLNIKWQDGAGALVREDGAYGPLFHADGVTPVTADDPATGQQVQVKSLLDLNGTNTRIYEAHMGMTQEWAVQLVALGYPEVLALSYDRVTGEADLTLGDLADPAYPGTSHETFHFVLNNTVVEDNRIPPYGMSYEVARVRNALPVPANQYGDPDANGVYNYWDTVTLSKPAGAVSAEIKLMYQPTSWEYIQFLSLANNGENAFLADEGRNMLEAWLNTDMAEPYVIASASWGAPPETCSATAPNLLNVTAGSNAEIQISWETVANVAGYRLYYDQAGKADLIMDCPTCTAYTDTSLTNGQQYCYKVTSHTDACESDFSTTLCATASQPGQITTVPELIGETQSAATQLILDAGLLLADPVGTAYSDTIAVDHVLSQSPAAGTQVQQDSQVNIVISLGPAPAVVCSTLESKPACSAEPSCAWEGKGKNGSCVDIAP
jgi:hypothetical protein